MTSHANYKTNYYNNKGSTNDNLKPKDMILSKDIDEKRKQKIIAYVTLYRKNVHLFCEHYFQIHLHPFQRIWMYQMGVKDSYVAICSRAIGKSWIVGIFACAIAVLYPNSNVIIVSSTKEQATGILEKIRGLKEDHPNLSREIKYMSTAIQSPEILFHNGSAVKVVASRDSSRGKKFLPNMMVTSYL